MKIHSVVFTWNF